MVNRMVRSTRVPIAEPSSPMIRSPPTPRQCPVVGFGGALADHHLVGDELPSPCMSASPLPLQRPAGAQARGQLPLERATTLQMKPGRWPRGDPHRLIFRELGPEPVADLLRTPRRAPATVRATSVTSCLPRHVRARDRPSLTVHHRPTEPILNVAPQGVVAGELGRPWAAAHAVRSATAPPTPGSPAGHRGWRRCGAAPERPSTRSAHAPGDLADADLLNPQQCDLLTLCEREILPDRGRRRIGGMPPPSRNHRDPTGIDTAHATAAPALEKPSLDPGPVRPPAS
jgi:hypothetical protein